MKVLENLQVVCSTGAYWNLASYQYYCQPSQSKKRNLQVVKWAVVKSTLLLLNL